MLNNIINETHTAQILFICLDWCLLPICNNAWHHCHASENHPSEIMGVIHDTAWQKPWRKTNRDTPPTYPSSVTTKRIPVPSALRQTGQALSITPASFHAPPFPENFSLRHHGPSWFRAWSAAVSIKSYTVEMNRGDFLRLSRLFIVRAVLPSLPLFWKWPCIFITLSYSILNNKKDETAKAPKRSSIRPWPSSFRWTAPLIRSWPDSSSFSCFQTKDISSKIKAPSPDHPLRSWHGERAKKTIIGSGFSRWAAPFCNSV